MRIDSLTLLTIFSVFYSLGTILIYFSKMRLNNIENKIYKILLISNLGGLILQFLCGLVSRNYNSIPSFLSDIVFRSFAAYFILWINLIFHYLLLVSGIIKNKRIYKYTLILSILQFILVCILPYEYYHGIEEQIFYTHGAAIKFIFIISFIIGALMIGIVILKRKNIVQKKVTPIYLFIILGILAGVIQSIRPDFIIMTYMETFICFLMYFTIENPDLKMINQLELARNTAEKSNRAKSDFISSMSHEIRTPLNAIVGFSEFIQTEEDPHEREECAKNILIASQTLLEIVNGILDISKIEADKMELIETKYELGPILESLANLMIPRIGEKNIVLKTDFAEDLPKFLYGDKTKIKQIITNLLTNAVKYTEKGEINFKVTCINEKGYANLRITVSDTGRGIDSSQIDRLFDKFSRLEEDKNTTIEGVGLGLAITKSLLQLLGGNITVQSKHHEGSTFIVNVKQKIVDEHEIEVINKQNEKIYFPNAKVLVVDDNNLNLLVAERKLKEYKINVSLVTSGHDCLNRIEDNEKYDIILMDDMMPKMNGKETLKNLQAINNFKIPVIALTANALKGNREEYLKLGFADYLTKPVDQEELTRVLTKYLSYTKETIVQTKETSSSNEIKIAKKENKIEDKSNRKKVLIVDDNLLNIKIATNTLKVYNFEIEGCLSGKEAIKKINNSKFYDLILLDDMMPDISGPETLKELKKIQGFNTPVISLTANTEEINTREYYLNLGFDEYLAKPINKAELDIVINKIFNNNDKINTLDKKGNIEYLKESGIDVEQGIRLLGDITMYNEIIQMFYNSVKDRLSKLNEYKLANNINEYIVLLVSLKSDCKYLGMADLFQATLDLELKVKENDLEYLENNHLKLLDLYKTKITIIEKYLVG